MEEQLAQVAAETYYYITIPLMILIHAGFLAYEMGSTRHKHVLTSGVKNILAFAFLVPTFYYFGWFLYWALGFQCWACRNQRLGLRGISCQSCRCGNGAKHS